MLSTGVRIEGQLGCKPWRDNDNALPDIQESISESSQGRN